MSTTEHQHPPKLPDDLSIRAVLAPPDSAADALEARVLAVLLDESDAAEQAAVACLLAENQALRTWHDEMKATLPLLREALHNGTAAPGLRMDETRRAALLEKLMATPDAVTRSGEKMPPANVIPWKNFLRQNFAALAACAALVLSIAAAAGLRLALDDSEAVGVASAQEVYTPSADANSMVITSNMAMPLSPPPAFGAPLASIPVSGGGLTVPAAAPAPVVDSEFVKSGFAVLDSGQANSETPAPAQKEKMVPLRIEVPKYSLMGTPVPISHFQVAPNSYGAKSAPPDATRASGQLGWNRGSSPNLEPSSPRANISNEESLAKSDESSANGIIPYASKTIIGGSASGNRNGYIDYRRVTGTGRIVRPGEEGSPEAVEEQRKRSDALSDTDNLTKTGSGTLDVTGSIGAEGSYSSDRRRMSFSGSITSGKRDEEPAPPPLPRPAPSVPRADTDAEANPFSTFSLNVSDAAFRLAAESLRQGRWPTADTLRTEEFVNALTYADPPPAPGEAVSLTQEQARDPFAHNRNLLRLTIQTASAGRDARQPLNLTILLDTSGSMERADRQATLQVALRALAENIQPQDTIGLIGFALTHRLFFQANGLQASQSLREIIGNIPPEGGTNLEQALIAAYAQNRKTATPNTLNRVVLLTDGAANLGDADPASLARLITENKKRGIGLDCYGIGFDDYNDTMLETLARTANGRYAYLNNAEEAREDFAKKLAGALQVAAQNVKVQLEFDPARVSAWRLLGYEKHRLQKEDFRDNTVAAAQLGAAENGTAVYSIALKPDGHGSIGTLRVRYQDPRTGDYRERDWAIPYDPTTPPLEHAASGIQLAASAALFAEKLEALPQAAAVSLKTLEAIVHTANTRQGEMPANRQLHTMLNQAQRLE